VQKENKMNINEIQIKMVQQFDRIGHLAEGLAAVSWLPGEGRDFSDPVRYGYDEVRPLALVLETTANGGLTFSIAISRPYKGRLVFVTHGKWDFRAPIIPGGRQQQMDLSNPQHRLNAKRAIDALHKVLDYGFAVKRGEAPTLAQPRWPDVLTLPNGRFVEDYSPVLGAEDRNALGDAASIMVRIPNPASRILARRGLESVEQAEKDPALFEELAAEIRSSAPDMELSESAVCEALLDPSSAVTVSVDIKTAAATRPADAAAYLRGQVSRRAANAATDHELLIAALNPDQPLVMRRLSAVQLCDIADWQEMPEPYVGALLAPVDWKPSSKFAVLDTVEATAGAT
jgi:hypothetical protein